MSKILSHESFFRKPTPKQLAQIRGCQFILESFCKETCDSNANKKIALTEAHLVLLEPIHQEYHPILFCQLNDRFRFQRMGGCWAMQSKTAEMHGFHLLNEDGQGTTIYLQFASLEELWLKYLTKMLVQIGFHQQYQVISKIGCGSSASVCSVLRLRDSQIFAAKIFPKSTLTDNPLKRQTIFNQIQILRAMDHPNILKILNVMESQTSYFMITQHLTGGNLFERMNRDRGITEQQTKQVMRGLMKALSYMHGFGVMHRDIKLQNIMLRSQETWEPVLIDFGLAAISDEQPYQFYRCGTPGFIAPEIISMRVKQHTDVVCDIFSCGALLHVLLTNSYLFQGRNNEQVYKANKAMNFELAGAKYQKQNEQGVQLMKGMLQLQPDQRISAQQTLQTKYLGEQWKPEKGTVSPNPTETGQHEITYQL